MPLGQNFNEWLKEQGKEPCSSELIAALDDVGHKMTEPEERKKTARAISRAMATILQQEYKMHKGRWWLWTLGKPARPLTDAEVEEKGLLALDLEAPIAR